MKRILTLAAFFACTLPLFAQLNMTLRSSIEYPDGLNDIWGWADPDTGAEYALVGMKTGVSIVSLADLDAAVELHRIPGPTSTWRDIKTWKNFAYVSNEEDDGILVIDLSKLPNEAPYEYWAPTVPEIGGQLASVHNVFIDERGILYLSGANLNNGGMIYVDVDTNPGQPEIINWNEPFYSHDVYVRDGLAYDAQINDGRMAVYDVSDLDTSILLATQVTPFAFTHNTWLSDDSKVVFTTDERGNAPVAAYDVSDLDDITLLDEYRPVETVGRGVVPHNVHVWDDWLLISYYTDGGRVVDASRPTNLIEVGNFDTWISGDGGTNGAWGLYPFLPSGTVLVSDIDNGLFVLTPNLVRACWLEGTVTEKGTTTRLNEVSISIDASQPNASMTDAGGEFETGIATAGTYDVTFTKTGYEPLTVSVDLENGVLKTLAIELEPHQRFQISGKVIKESDGSGIEDAMVLLQSDQFTYTLFTDSDGNYSLDAFGGTYDIIAGAWGYRHGSASRDLNSNMTAVIELEKGYQDDFVFDFDWKADSDGLAASGYWVREVPVGTSAGGGLLANPGSDLDADLGDKCFITGNGGGNAGTDDIDDGEVSLTSPTMDLTDYNNPVLKFHRWFYNVDRGSNSRNDSLSVFADNGTDKVLVMKTTEVTTWTATEINLKDYLQITDKMTVSFVAADFDPGHVTEAAIDGFEIIEGAASSNQDLVLDVKTEAFPNPFEESLSIRYDSEIANTMLSVKNVLGQEIEQYSLANKTGIITTGTDWLPGVYFVQISTRNKKSEILKLVKQ